MLFRSVSFSCERMRSSPLPLMLNALSITCTASRWHKQTQPDCGAPRRRGRRMRARRSPCGKGRTQRRVPASVSDLDRRTGKNPAFGGLLSLAFGQARKRPPPRCAWHPPGKRTRRGRRVRPVVIQRPVPQATDNRGAVQARQPTHLRRRLDPAAQRDFLSELRVLNIVV